MRRCVCVQAVSKVTDFRAAECIYTRRWPQAGSPTASKSARPPSSSGVSGNGEAKIATRKPLSKEDDAKLVFGTVFSLRNMVKRFGGDDDV